MFNKILFIIALSFPYSRFVLPRFQIICPEETGVCS